MGILVSKIRNKSDIFQKNELKMTELLVQLQKHLAESRFQGREKYISRAKKMGKLTARERIELLLDQDSFFLEFLLSEFIFKTNYLFFLKYNRIRILNSWLTLY